MTEKVTLGNTPRVITLTFNVPDYLAVSLARMRYLLEAGIQGRRSIHRGEIVRLALERLYLDFVRHESLDPLQKEQAMAEYDRIRLRLEFDPMCPDWLLPAILIPKESANGNEGTDGATSGRDHGRSKQDSASVLHGSKRPDDDGGDKPATTGTTAPKKQKQDGRKRKGASG